MKKTAITLIIDDLKEKIEAMEFMEKQSCFTSNEKQGMKRSRVAFEEVLKFAEPLLTTEREHLKEAFLEGKRQFMIKGNLASKDWFTNTYGNGE